MFTMYKKYLPKINVQKIFTKNKHIVRKAVA